MRLASCLDPNLPTNSSDESKKEELNMQVHYGALAEIDRYIEASQRNSHYSIDCYDQIVSRYLRVVAQGLDGLTERARILEIGIGTGWFPIICKLRGLQCHAVEISPQLVEYARRWGRSLGVDPDVELGNVESTSLGDCVYDAVIAANVFEHVENWKLALTNIYRCLKPGGTLYFESTNKFALRSGEYSFPLYGWLPDWVRYKIRVIFDDREIMKLGIDFNQFRYSQLRREFKRIGFSRVLDRIEMAQDDMISSSFRKMIVRVSREVPVLKTVALTFCEVTRFLCIK
jgi:2-polyprenyl-3-methyl-5-hydroxy-6-metoxy-1,4-benzoquinol methylase